MKRTIAIALFVVSKLVSGPALAQTCRPTDPPNTCQSVGIYGFPPWNDAYLEGQGLELLNFTAQSGTTAFPPPATTVLLPKASCGTMTTKLTSVTVKLCTAEARGMAICQIDATGDKVCGGMQGRGVIMVKGFWDGKGKWSAGAPGTVTLSCAAEGAKDQFPEVDGAITSCIEMGYHPKTNQDQFLACIRAIRADYCGDGKPRTLVGTLLEIHDPDVNPMSDNMCQDFNLAYEATWSKEGALCIYHDRWNGENMTFEKECPDRFTQHINGAACSSKAEPVVTTRSQCNVCPSTTNPTRANVMCAGVDEDPVCSAKSHKHSAHAAPPKKAEGKK